MSIVTVPNVRDVFVPTFPGWKKKFWPSKDKELIHQETPGLRFMRINNMPNEKGKEVCFASGGHDNIETVDAVMFTEEEEWVWIQAKFATEGKDKYYFLMT